MQERRKKCQDKRKERIPNGEKGRTTGIGKVRGEKGGRNSSRQDRIKTERKKKVG
jgi:hypothetical protein